MDNLFGIVAWPTRDSWGGYNCIRIPILLTGDNYRTLLVNVQTILSKNNVRCSGHYARKRRVSRRARLVEDLRCLKVTIIHLIYNQRVTGSSQSAEFHFCATPQFYSKTFYLAQPLSLNTSQRGQFALTKGGHFHRFFQPEIKTESNILIQFQCFNRMLGHT